MTPDTKELTQSQSLFQLEHELVELMALREEMAEAGEDVTACDQQIQEYAKRELRKVDGIRQYLRHAQIMEEAAKAEAARLEVLARRWKAKGEWLKGVCQGVMEHFGIKRIEGQTGSLSLRGNGGFAPLTITDESLIPEELCDYRGVISGAAWAQLAEYASASIITAGTEKEAEANWRHWLGRQDVQMERHPNNGKIREALKRGPVAGVRLEERGTSLVVR